jgi:SH3-like domain-containing protein
MKLAFATLVTLAVGGSSAAAGDAYRTCSISAYVIDQDAKGMNIRAGPSTKARVVKVVNGPNSGTTKVRGYQAGWFRVSQIDAAEEDAVYFKGDGWVHASRLHIDVAAADPNLWEGPSRRSKLIRRLAGDQPDVTLVSCSGNWAEIRVGNTLGWLSPAGQCSNPLTTCA